ncbi:MAG: ZIP family metal transporter [Lachnospiraceae bacterium]|nr:ZIP family metal transporter [Lachnospiraceae bacterium]
MNTMMIIGILIPFVGTTLGSACVFFMKNEIKPLVQKSLLGFASGVMIAASVWSLLIPAIDMSDHMGKMAFVPAAVGIIIGMAFLFAMDKLTPHLHLNSDEPEGPHTKLRKTTMLVLAVTLHNIPEGMAVGVVFAGLVTGSSEITIAGAIALAVGIAIQNFPEGAIIALPLKSEGNSKSRAFMYGTLSGIVEPIAAVLTVLLSQFVIPVLPYLLSFAAGAMLYVVVEELLPEASAGEHSDIGTIGFAIGFIVMMVLDVALG